MSNVRHPFHAYIRLEQPRLGTCVTFATDDFFAAKERLIDPTAPVFVVDKYDDNGKWRTVPDRLVRPCRRALHNLRKSRVCIGRFLYSVARDQALYIKR